MHDEYAEIHDAAAETTTCGFMHKGTSTWRYRPNAIKYATSVVGCGHHVVT